MTLKFDRLREVYPTSSREDLLNSLGGGWPVLINSAGFQNTCALRISVSLMALGNAPPADLVASDGNLKNNAVQSLIVRVASAATWLEQLLGPSDWGINKLIGAKIDGLIPPWSGILLFRVPGATDASGHGDLWRNMPCRVDCHSDFARAARSVEIWRLK